MALASQLVSFAKGNVRRTFWLTLGAFVTGEGLIGFFALQLNGFPKDVELARTLVSALLCSTIALAGLELIERGWLPRYARASARTAMCTLPLLASFVWLPRTGAWSDLHWSLAVVLVGALPVSAQRIWIGDWSGIPVKRGVFIVTAASIAVVVPSAVAAIWGWHSPEAARWLSSFSFLTFVGLLLTPFVRRAYRKRLLGREVQ